MRGADQCRAEHASSLLFAEERHYSPGLLMAACGAEEDVPVDEHSVGRVQRLEQGSAFDLVARAYVTFESGAGA